MAYWSRRALVSLRTLFPLALLLLSLSACQSPATRAQTTSPAATARASANPPTPTPGIPAGNDWTQYRFDTSGTGTNPEDTITSATAPLLTSHWTDGGIFGGHAFESTPAVYEGVIYVTNGDSLLALDLTTGRELWHYDDNPPSKLGSLSSSVAIDPQTGVAYFGTTDARAVAVNTMTHQLLWQVRLGPATPLGYIWSSPLLVHGRVYIGLASRDDHPCVRGAAYALAPDTGQTVWVHYTVPASELGGGVWSSMVADPDEQAVLVTTGNPCDAPETAPVQGGASDADQNAILALNWDTGASLWRYTAVSNDSGEDLDFGQGAVTFTDQGQKYVVAGNKLGVVYALTPPAGGKTPAVAWTRTISQAGFLGQGGIFTPPTYRNGIVYVAGGPSPDGGCPKGAVWALRARTGAVLWRQCTAGQVVGAPSITGDVLFVGQHLAVVAYAAATGKILWHGAINGDVWGGVTVSHGFVILGTVVGNSRLYCFALPPGV
jgi:outer membrane protein assembly factor BamB